MPWPRRPVVVVVASMAAALALPGCVMGIDGFTVMVHNETDDDTMVHIEIKDTANGTIGFHRVVSVKAGDHKKFEDLGLWEGDFEAWVYLPQGDAQATRGISDTCGSCLFNIHIADDGIRMGTDVLD